MHARLQAYGWVTGNIVKLNELLNSTPLSVEEANIVYDIFVPTRRMGLLKSLVEGFQKALSPAEQLKLQGVLDSLHTQATQLTARIDRLTPENGHAMSDAGRLMLQKLNLFAPQDLSKELYEYELEDLALTISTVDPVGHFKERLEQLHKRIADDVLEQKINRNTVGQITQSQAMQLCRYTHKMLDVVLNKDKSADDKLAAIETFEDKCDQTSGMNKFLKWIGAVVIAAVVTVLVTAAIVGIAAIIGTCFGGPAGTVAGAVAGLVQGVYSAAGVGIAVASFVTGVTVSGLVSPHTLFKKSGMRVAADNVVAQASDYKDYVPPAAAPSA